jgi:hypothetical protein
VSRRYPQCEVVAILGGLGFTHLFLYKSWEMALKMKEVHEKDGYTVTLASIEEIQRIAKNGLAELERLALL